MRGNSPRTLDDWLRRLEWSLNALPPKDRAEIARETRSHIEERIAQGISEQDALFSMGKPEDYAQGFNDDFELSKALGSRESFEMMRVVAQWLTRSAAAGAALVAVSCLGLFAAGVILTALMRFFDPVHWGLWLSSHFVLFGHVDRGDQARELLGAWIYPFAVVSLVACWLAGRAALLSALRTIARH
jgi:uncharacterized membrane protein